MRSSCHKIILLWNSTPFPLAYVPGIIRLTPDFPTGLSSLHVLTDVSLFVHDSLDH